ncbi:MAG: hypothetical protein AAGL49_14560, partial [Pseudomonadota bacterium]
HIRINERCAPLPRPIRGEIVVRPRAFTETVFDLDGNAKHHWSPIAPCAEIQVDLDAPALSWRGEAYLDSNSGDEPLEAGFQSWTWARVHTDLGALILYEATPRAAGARALSLHADMTGRLETRPMPAALTEGGKTIWGVERPIRADCDGAARVLATFEDAPFYARSLIETRLFGETARGFHESLSLDRFRTRWVRALLPFRMPRIAG